MVPAVFGIAAQGGVKPAIGVIQADFRKVVGGETERRGEQRRKQWDVLHGIVYHFKQRDCGTDFRQEEKPFCLVRAGGYSKPGQLVHISPGVYGFAAQQYAKITVPRLSLL